jgi:hypothetical protein
MSGRLDPQESVPPMWLLRLARVLFARGCGAARAADTAKKGKTARCR